MEDKRLEYIDLFNGLNQNPIPLEFAQSMSTSKNLAAMQKAINQLITNVNELFSEGIQYTNNEISMINDILNGIDILDGKFLKNKSVTMNKLSDEALSTMHDRIMSYIGNIMKFVTFEINSDGYFVANVPETWGGISFSTDVEGHLILNINY